MCDFSVFNISLEIGLSIWFSNLIGFTAGLVASYLGNRKYAFSDRALVNTKLSMSLYLLFNIILALLIQLFLSLLSSLASSLFTLNLVRLALVAIATIFRFFIYSRFIFA